MVGSPHYPFAHTSGDPNCETWEPLYSKAEECGGLACPACERLERHHGHANKTACWTGRFASRLVPENEADTSLLSQWGYLIGLWHDLGKFAPRWQRYLAGKAGLDLEEDEASGTVDHSTAGAQHAVGSSPVLGRRIAMIIAGHHAGLPDTIGETASLDQRLRKETDIPSLAPEEVLRAAFPDPPPFLRGMIRDGNATAFFCRLLFSCLVDADFLATESFMAPERTGCRTTADASVFPAMLERLQRKIDSFGMADDPVSLARRRVYEACLKEADQAPGFFSLTVPTGGGKTLSSLAFALKHALAHGKRRIIYVIPFTSIIEQNADVFNDLFRPLAENLGASIVLEHHSNLHPDRETTESRLAAENWDAPLIVTTAVQFYESLHAARTSSCRKLHRIAGSVVILDEAQCLPVDYLKMCLGSLDQLTQHYGTSVVLCTATPPAIGRRQGFEIGLSNIREIVPDREALYRDLKRVNVVVRGTLSDDRIASEMAEHEQVLTIVNTRSHAQRIFQKLPKHEGNFHLSALMCPEHRREVLREVRRRLKRGEVTRLVSTQLIEAGVDVDFPRAYRSLAGIDAIAQAAGRCNRNGKLRGRGELHLFFSEEIKAEQYFNATTSVAREVLALHDDPLTLEAVELFFTLYYHRHAPQNGSRWDTKNISDLFQCVARDRQTPFLFQFRTAANAFRLIESEQIAVLIPYDDQAEELLDTLRDETIPLHRDLLRRLQSYTVQIHEREFQQQRSQFESVRQGAFHLLICPGTHYSPHFGLHFDPSTTSLPLIVS